MIVDYIEYGPKNIGKSSGGEKQELMLEPMEKLHSATYKKRHFGFIYSYTQKNSEIIYK